VNHLNKLLIAFINIIFFVSCASNIQDNSYQSKELISIDKPKVVYNFKKLPKRINVFLFDTNQTTEREFINGLSINYYYYKNLSNYSPEINFITSKKIDEGNCKLNKESQDYSIILLNDTFLGRLDPYCLNKLLNLNGILILSSDNLKVKELNQEVLHVSRQNEYRDLLTYAKNNKSKNSLIIDDEDPVMVPLFWVWYPTAREVLHEAKVFNPQNSAQPISFDHILNSRRFNGVIYQVDNIQGDRQVKEYIADNAMMQLLESQRIKEQIRNFEIDMWNY